MSEIITTISYDQDEIIRDIMALYTGEFDLDPTFSKGVFYRNLPRPRLCYDICPQAEGVEQSDCRNLPLDDASISSINFDPPFITGSVRRGKTGIMKDRFSYFKNVPELWDFYRDSLREFNRILKPNGWLVFKCQDIVDGHVNHFTHVEVMNLAVAEGFTPIDLFILLAKSRVIQNNLKKQQHARKFHSYFWVFKKRICRVAYSAPTPPAPPKP